MAQLVLINGAPGSGKSTLARQLAQDRPLTLALDVDVIKHALGQWEEDQGAAGWHARRLALALVREQLRSGNDVIVSQYLARLEFVEQLEHVAAAARARFIEIILDVGAPTLADRLSRRAALPERPEHVVNARHVFPSDAPRLVASLNQVNQARRRAVHIDGSGSLDDTLDIVRGLLAGLR